jgi:glucokinase
MPNIEGMANVPIREEVSRRLSIPAVLENDANAAAYGEYLSEAGRGAGNLVLLTLGTGVGCGVIIDGKILHGSHGIGAELGHMMIVPDGEQCGCGQRGCLERYCSATYIAQGAQRLIEQEHRESSLKTALAAKGTIDAKDINEARKRGDQLAAQVWDRATYYLAMGLVNVCRLFDPDRIVLAGGLANAGDDLMLPLQEHFRRLRWSLAEPMTKIVFSRLGNDAGVIGAAGVAWQKFAPARS